MSTHALEAALVQGLAGMARRLPWRASLGVGARIGDVVRALGIRRRVAEENLRRSFPDWSDAERARVLEEHYRELGRIVLEYPRMPELSKAPVGEFVAEIRGAEHLLAARERGRGAVFVTGHLGNFELAGACVGRFHPLDFVARPLSNPRVERWVDALRRRAGLDVLHTDVHVRRMVESLRRNRWVALLADQDARSAGVFVPFLGRPASTWTGPARLALATGAPFMTAFVHRDADGRHHVEIDAPFEMPGPEVSRDDAVATLTARHAAALEGQVRAYPAQWFWLHRRWKTAPPEPRSG